MFWLKRGREEVEITKELEKLRRAEPPNSTHKMILRTNIMGYELGAIQEFTSKNSQEQLPDYIKQGLKDEAMLGMADLITQCRMLCLDVDDWNFDEIQKLGLDHLKERHKDFKKEGFGGVNQ